jgi:hypothetical protein
MNQFRGLIGHELFEKDCSPFRETVFFSALPFVAFVRNYGKNQRNIRTNLTNGRIMLLIS